jgi:hypothetical protein
LRREGKRREEKCRGGKEILVEIEKNMLKKKQI